MQEYLYYEHGDSSRGNLLTGYNGKTITSDTIGNMLFDGSWTYTWEHGRELVPMPVTYNCTNFYYATNIQGDVTAICKIER